MSEDVCFHSFSFCLFGSGQHGVGWYGLTWGAPFLVGVALFEYQKGYMGVKMSCFDVYLAGFWGFFSSSMYYYYRFSYTTLAQA